MIFDCDLDCFAGKFMGAQTGSDTFAEGIENEADIVRRVKIAGRRDAVADRFDGRMVGVMADGGCIHAVCPCV